MPLRYQVSFLGKDIDKDKDRITVEDIPIVKYPIVFRRDSETLRAELNIEVVVTLDVKGHFREGRIIIEKMENPIPDGRISDGKADKIGNDGAQMVLIPAGEFQMGSNDSYDDEMPVHTVYLDAFYIDKYEVTNANITTCAGYSRMLI